MNTFDAYIKYVPQTLFGINFCLQTAAMESMEKIGVFILSAEAAPLVEELIGASKNVGELYDFLEIYMRANIRKCSMGIYLARKHTLKDLKQFFCTPYDGHLLYGICYGYIDVP